MFHLIDPAWQPALLLIAHMAAPLQFRGKLATLFIHPNVPNEKLLVFGTLAPAEIQLDRLLGDEAVQIDEFPFFPDTGDGIDVEGVLAVDAFFHELPRWGNVQFSLLHVDRHDLPRLPPALVITEVVFERG